MHPSLKLLKNSIFFFKKKRKLMNDKMSTAFICHSSYATYYIKNNTYVTAINLKLHFYLHKMEKKSSRLVRIHTGSLKCFNSVKKKERKNISKSRREN